MWEVLLSPDSQRHSGGMVLELLLPDSQRHSGGSGAGAALARLTESFWRFWCRSCSCPTHRVILEVLVRELLLPNSQPHSGGSGAGAALARLGSAIPDLVQDLLHVPQRGGA